MTSLKGVSSMKIHRDLKVTQKTAWFMLHRIREAWSILGPLPGLRVEADETYVGGERKNFSLSKRRETSKTKADNKTIVGGIKDRHSNEVRAEVVSSVDAKTLQLFVESNTDPMATVYTDENKAYCGLDRNHDTVCHSAQEYVRDDVHTNGIEAFWSMLKRAHIGVYHKISPKHLDRYAKEFAGRHNIRELDTIDQLKTVVRGLCWKSLRYKDLIADNGLSNGARSA